MSIEEINSLKSQISEISEKIGNLTIQDARNQSILQSELGNLTRLANDFENRISKIQSYILGNNGTTGFLVRVDRLENKLSNVADQFREIEKWRSDANLILNNLSESEKRRSKQYTAILSTALAIFATVIGAVVLNYLDIGEKTSSPPIHMHSPTNTISRP